MSASKSGASTATTGLGPEGIMTSVQSSMAAAMAIPQKVMEANLETGAELLGFMSRRMKSQSELWNAVGHSHGVDGAVDAQRKFVSGISSDYAEEMTHLAAIFKKNLETVTAAFAAQMKHATKS